MRARNLTQNRTTAIEDSSSIPPPGQELYFAVRGGLLRHRKQTLGAWCEENGFAHHMARNALFGSSNTPEAAKLRERLIEDAKLAA